MEKRIAELERENAILRQQLQGSSAQHYEFTGPTHRLPPGHSQFSWTFGAQGSEASASAAAALEETATAAVASSDGEGSSLSHAEVFVAEREQGFLRRLAVKDILRSESALIGQQVTVCGWARTVRTQSDMAFVEINDGSSFGNLQAVVAPTAEGWTSLLENKVIGTCFMINGVIVKSPAKGQLIECQVSKITVLGSCPGSDYPLAKGRQPLEHLRSIAHLRARTNTIGAMMRVRNALAYAVHQFFQQRDFFYVHAPLITSSDCEGAGEMFAVTTLLQDTPSKIQVTPEGKIDYTKDFFEAPTFLTVSGQLEGEAYACAMSKIYTFGPTFRAEVSHTPRHLAEFWMIEPEVAFANLEDIMDLGEAFLKHCCAHVLHHCKDELEFFEKQYGKDVVPSLQERLREVVEKKFVRLPYKEAIQELLKADRTWQFPPKMGEDLASEHEKYITEVLVKGPTFVTNWPKGIKSFYMRQNDDGETVAAVDCLLPKVGEIIGGSQREERLDVLRARMAEMNIAESHLSWYLDLRRFGSCPHAGFGLGFERMVLFCTGLENIRDVIPFPRYPGHAEF